MICACSSAWQDELPAGAENPDLQGKQTEDPVTALNVPGKHGVHDSLLAPPIEYEATGQLPDGDDRPRELQYLPGEQGVQVDIEAFPGEKDPKGHLPLTDIRPKAAQYLPGSQGVQEDVFAPEGE